mgnify:CR=1 FL=1
MTGRKFIRNFLIFLFIGSVAQPAFAAPVQYNEIDYDITVRIDPIARTIEGKSIITVKNPREINLVLGQAFEVTEALFNGGLLGIGREQANQPHLWKIPFNLSQQHQFEIHWRGKLAQLDDSLDHQQTLGRPIAVSGEAGTFLPDASGWYPRVADGLARYKVTLELPAGQRGLVAGRLIEESESAQGYRAAFEFPHPANSRITGNKSIEAFICTLFICFLQKQS